MYISSLHHDLRQMAKTVVAAVSKVTTEMKMQRSRANISTSTAAQIQQQQRLAPATQVHGKVAPPDS
jgi:hypothetical protein